MTRQRALALILAAYLVLGTMYAIITPAFEASDELWHYPMIRHLANGNPLPVQVFDPQDAGPWKQEASQPPLYYYVGAALTFWIDTSDMEHVRWLNPHVDNGRITADGNINLVVHDPELNRWQGTLLAITIIRLFSVLLGGVTVYLTYRIGAELSPERPEIALGAAGANAFIPMFLFISGAVNNDNLAIPLASLAVFMMIRAVKDGKGIEFWMLLGIVIGLALLTKEGTFALLPLAWGTALLVQWRRFKRHSTREGEQYQVSHVNATQFARLIFQSLTTFFVVLAPAILIAGWWYVRNIRLYGDWLGWNAFIAVLGQRSQPASLAQLWDERGGFMMSYWGLFGGVNVPMAPWIYQLLNAVLFISILGFAVYLVQLQRRRRQSAESANYRPRSLLAYGLDLVESQFALVICVLFAIAVVYGLIQWATTTWSSQGRLVFTAISALNVLMILGLVGWLPRAPATAVAGLFTAALFVIAAVAPFLWIRRAYQPESYLSAAQETQPLDTRIEYSGPSDAGAKLRLIGASLAPADPDLEALRPGDAVDVVTEWEVLAPMSRNWSAFVHLYDLVLGAPAAQRDMYPEQGLNATTLLEVGQRIHNYYRVAIPDTAIAPAKLEARVGWYDYYTGDRLLSADGSDSTNLGVVDLVARTGEQPNPVAVNFGNEIELVGFDITPRVVSPGEQIELKLHWVPIRPPSEDYTIFAQVVGEDTTLWASFDLFPEGGTSSWSTSEVQTMTLLLPVSDDTPGAVYPLHLGAYTRTEDGGFQRLQVVTPDGRITQDDFLLLTRVRVN